MTWVTASAFEHLDLLQCRRLASAASTPETANWSRCEGIAPLGVCLSLPHKLGQALPHITHRRLQLGVGILPQIEETSVMLQRLALIAEPLVDLGAVQVRGRHERKVRQRQGRDRAP